MATEEEYYNELSYDTLAHPDPAFIHQHIVDAYIAQHADEKSQPIGITFALIGLYLYVEKQFTGKQIQRAQMELAIKKKGLANVRITGTQRRDDCRPGDGGTRRKRA